MITLTLYSTELRRLVGMLRTGDISQGELLHGLRIARTYSTRSSAEKEAKAWFESNAPLPRHTREFALAVGYLAKYRLTKGTTATQFSTLVVRLLIGAGISVEEAEKVLDLTREHFAGALELIRLHEEGRISEAEVDLAIEVTSKAEDAVEAARRARDLLERSPSGYTARTYDEFVFCVVCLWSLGENSERAMAQTVGAIQQAVYAREDHQLAAKAPVTTFDPNSPRPMVVQTTTELLYFGRPAGDGYREVAVTPPAPGETIFPPRMARILGMGYDNKRGSVEGRVVGFREIRIGHPMLLRPPQPLEGTELWATSPVTSVQIL